MSRRWLVVIEDPQSIFTLPEELEQFLTDYLAGAIDSCKVARVQRGGLLADKIMGELPPVRHELMGRPR